MWPNNTIQIVYLRLVILLPGGSGLDTKSCWILATPWIIASQTPLSMGFSRQEYLSRLPFPFLGIFLTQESNLNLLHCRRILYQLSYEGSPTFTRG